MEEVGLPADTIAMLIDDETLIDESTRESWRDRWLHPDIQNSKGTIGRTLADSTERFEDPPHRVSIDRSEPAATRRPNRCETTVCRCQTSWCWSNSPHRSRCSARPSTETANSSEICRLHFPSCWSTRSTTWMASRWLVAWSATKSVLCTAV